MRTTMGSASLAEWFDAPQPSGIPGKWRWAPIPVFLLIILVLWVADLRTVHEFPRLILALNFVFLTSVSLAIAVLIGRSFLGNGSPGLLLLGCGAVIWGCGGVASTLVGLQLGAPGRVDVNSMVTVYNLAAWLAALLHLCGVLSPARRSFAPASRLTYLLGAYAAATAALALVIHVAVNGLVPVFYVPGHGTTDARRFVMGSSIAMFALAATLLFGIRGFRPLRFRYWYALALLLLATGLLGVMIAPAVGSPLSWVGRAAQYVGGAYMLIAALLALREAGAAGIAFRHGNRRTRHPYAVAVVVVAIGVVVREVMMGALDERFIFITMFPAVMISALYGGLRAGLLATGLALLVSDFLWIAPRGTLAVASSTEAVSMIVFGITGALSALIAEGMHRARARAHEAEAEAAVQGDRLRMILETLPQFIWTSSPTGERDYVSPQLMQYTGAAESELLGLGWVQFLHPYDRSTALQAWEKAAALGTDYDAEYRFRAADGSYRWFKARAIPERDGRGRILRWFGSSTDIDDLRKTEQELKMHQEHLEFLVSIRTADLEREVVERKRVEDDLRRREREFRTLANGVPAIIARFDRQHRHVFVNSAVTPFLGLAPEAFIGRTSAEMGMPPAQCEAWSAMLEKAFTTGQTVTGEFEIRGRNGCHCFAVVVAPELLPDDSVESVISVLTDITDFRRAHSALQRSETTLAEAQRLANIGGWEWDVVSGEIFWSRQMFIIFGEDERQYRPTWDSIVQRIHPDDLKRIDTLVRRAIRRGISFDAECRVVRRSGEVRNVRVRGEASGGAKRNRRLVGVLMDVTMQKEVEHALQSARQDAEQANEAKSRFLAATSHDLRQPLSALALYVDVFQQHAAPGQRPIIENMRNCVGSLNELLTNLLDLSKLDAGVVKPNVTEFSALDTLGNLVSVHSPEARLKGLRLCCHACDVTVRTDPVLFARILGNLLANAIRYTEKGGVLIGCRRHRGKMWIEVWDTGIGIPAEKRTEIFEEFKQLDASRQRGSGLGLAIVAKTAALLGLDIRVNSKPGRGSMFAIEMPLGQAVETPVRQQPSLRPTRIALVEDNAEIRQVLVYLLQSVGHDVVAAESGAELLVGLGNAAPQLIVTDHRLRAGETGFDVIADVRSAFGASIPAIIITGDTDPALMREMLDRGVVVHHKPLQFDALQQSIGTLIAAR